MECADGIQVSYLDLPTMLAPFAMTSESSPVKVGGFSFTSVVLCRWLDAKEQVFERQIWLNIRRVSRWVAAKRNNIQALAHYQQEDRPQRGYHKTPRGGQNAAGSAHISTN